MPVVYGYSDYLKAKEQYCRFLDGKDAFPGFFLRSSNTKMGIIQNNKILKVFYSCVVEKEYDNNKYRFIYDMALCPEKEARYGLYEYHYGDKRGRYFYDYDRDMIDRRCIRTLLERRVYFFCNLFGIKDSYAVAVIPIIIEQYRAHWPGGGDFSGHPSGSGRVPAPRASRGKAYPKKFFGSKECRETCWANPECTKTARYRAAACLLSYYESPKGGKLRDIAGEAGFLIGGGIRGDKTVDVETVRRQLKAEYYNAYLLQAYRNLYRYPEHYMVDALMMYGKFEAVCEKFGIWKDEIRNFLEDGFKKYMS